MPLSKKVHVREHTVRAHERVIYSRIYLFICKDCNQDVRRETFGGRPIYCDKCRPSQAKKNESQSSKKRPRPVLVESQKVTHDNGLSAARWSGQTHLN